MPPLLHKSRPLNLPRRSVPALALPIVALKTLPPTLCFILRNKKSSVLIYPSTSLLHAIVRWQMAQRKVIPYEICVILKEYSLDLTNQFVSVKNPALYFTYKHTMPINIREQYHLHVCFLRISLCLDRVL